MRESSMRDTPCGAVIDKELGGFSRVDWSSGDKVLWQKVVVA